MNQILTQEYLKSILHYDLETGVFTNKVQRNSSSLRGSVAGNLDKYGYLIIGINKKYYKSHRLAWLYVYGTMPENQIDHINHIKNDNRICNLREVTHQENQRNAGIRKDNKTGIVGIKWNKSRGKYEATIRINKKDIYLGLFDNIDEAILARKKSEQEHGFHKNHGMQL